MMPCNVWLCAERSCCSITEVDQTEPSCCQRSFQSFTWSAQLVLQFVLFMSENYVFFLNLYTYVFV